MQIILPKKGICTKVLINAKNPFSGETYRVYPGHTRLSPEAWHIIEIEMTIEEGGMLFYSLDGVLEAEGPMHPDTPFKVDLKGVHAGAYGAYLPLGSFIRNGPIEILWWS